MGRIEIVHAPDSSAGRVPNKSQSNRSLLDGKVVTVKKTTPNDYKNNFQPQKTAGRMTTNTDVPKSLTPKGYTKMQLMLSIAKKQYDSIVKKLKGTGKLWEDPDFPANDKSLGAIPKLPPLEWKRPRDINPTAEFIVDGFDRSDVKQGFLGDCWLLAVISSMADIPALFETVAPPGQMVNSKDYVGLFRFRFWRFGNWVEVLVDDRLPVKKGTNQLVFMHSDESNEIWSALMEKAYAKLNGSYANLSGGTQGEAMEDMTGGLYESMDMSKMTPKDVEKDLVKFAKRCCLMGCSITSTQIEGKLDNGLITGHAYSVTDVDKVKLKTGEQPLVRVRNPWGNNYEWKGDWCDRSPKWNDVSDAEKKRLDVTFTSDGEFWMSIADFQKFFTKLEVCHLGHESLESGMSVHGKKRLEETVFLGNWQKNVSAGGCANNRDTFWTNPQYCITVKDPDPNDAEDLCHVAIGLMQDTRKAGRRACLTIGFAVYKLPDNSDTKAIRKRDFFASNRPVYMSEFSNGREVSLRLKISPGIYMIVPSTFNPNEECQFLIRIFTETMIVESECDNANSLKGLPDDLVKALKEEEKLKNEDDVVDKLFNQMANPVSKSIDSEQLQELLNKTSLKPLCTDPKGFSLESARSMLAAMDNNLTGQMEYDELKKLWESCQCWQMIFKRRDKDNSKNLNAAELREALEEAGFNLSGVVFTIIVQRFVSKKSGAVSFEDWILACCRLMNAFENLNAQPKNNSGHLMFSEEDFLRLTMNQ